jgi:hypothetical protein
VSDRPLMAVVLLSAACGRAAPPEGIAADHRVVERRETAPVVAAAAASAPAAGLGYLKGSTHVHTVHSGDSKTSVDEVVGWYVAHGYDFIVLTDHNRVSDYAGEAPLVVVRGIELTHNPGSCQPPPPEPDGKCRIHVNGIGLPAGAVSPAVDGRPPAIEWKNPTSSLRVDMYQAAFDKTRELGGISQVNHPTWHWGVDGALLAELSRRGAVLVEVANMGFRTWSEGDDKHAGAEAVWDDALGRGALVWGVASDDAHDYDDLADERQAAGARVYPPGGGWVMVRAERSPEAIRAALERGDFYSSTGVTLERAEVLDGALDVAVAAASPGRHQIAFVGQGGVVLDRLDGRSAKFSLDRLTRGYVRAVVTREDGARAWVQPVRIP